MRRKEEKEIIKNVQNVLFNVAKIEYERKLNQLIIDVTGALNNPHNTFKGTAQDYIKQYHLDLDLKDKIFKHYRLTKIQCPFCGEPKTSRQVICPCEVKNTGMTEFWKD
jgi:hypothetical protein